MSESHDGVSRRGFLKVAGITAATVMLPGGIQLFTRGGILYAAEPRSCGAPPTAAPQRIKGGESFPPLPLPATPIRRSERKREPAPPTLVGKVVHGQMKWANEDGNRYQYRDWTTDPADVRNLLDWTNSKLGIRYRPVDVELKDFSYSPSEIPVLYFTGHEAFALTENERRGLRQFLTDGGFIIGDACCGMKAFADSFQREIDAVLPNRRRYVMSEDHPLLESFYRIGQVDYQVEGKGSYKDRVQIEGMNIGCRTAVFFTRQDLSCGWDHHVHPHGARVMPSSALELGANLITYTLATYQLGRFLSTEKVYYQSDRKTRDEFVFGQVRHDGDWDPDPSAVMNLLKYVGRYSTMDVQFKRADVDLANGPEVFKRSFLYMTGHHDFALSGAEVANLRKFLSNGGVLLADACCGRQTFDTAFRRELAKVLPGEKLERMKDDHPLYSSLEKIRTVDYTDLIQQARPGFNAPPFEAISLNGVLSVVYSKYDLGCGWEEIDHPYSRGVASADSLKLGMNSIVYAMTH